MGGKNFFGNFNMGSNDDLANESKEQKNQKSFEEEVEFNKSEDFKKPDFEKIKGKGRFNKGKITLESMGRRSWMSKLRKKPENKR